MKSQIFKFVALLALFIGWFSCTEDEDNPNGFQWDDSTQQEEFRPVNPGGKSSYFKIDDNIISFAVPYLVGTRVNEYPSEPGWGSPEGFSPHIWTITLVMAKGVDVTKLAPVITLAPGATITQIDWRINTERFPPILDDVVTIDVDYTGIAEVGVYNFKCQVVFTVRASDGSIVNYIFLAVAIGNVSICCGCP